MAEEVTGQAQGATEQPYNVMDAALAIARQDLGEKPRDESGRFTKAQPETQTEEAKPETEATQEGEQAAEQETEEAQQPEADWEKLKSLKRKLRVKAEDGSDEEVELSLEEMEKGVMLERSYRQKTAQLAREREAVEKKVREAIAERQKEYDEKLQVTEQVLWHSLAPEIQNTDWNKLAAEDPAEWARRYQHVQNVNAKLAHVQAERKRLADEQQKDVQENLKKQAEEAVETLQREIPGWNNDVYGKILKVGQEYGFKAEEVNAITDPRAIKVLHDAMQYRALKAKPAVEKRSAPQAPKVVKPGAGEKPDPNADQWKQGMANLRKTGRSQDAVPLAMEILRREGFK